ncbi:MAG TPA: hypothetical protein DC049_09255 [Spirochaetia bacterium]|nr:hypothetical protein [Spirochaetia bacterium]
MCRFRNSEKTLQAKAELTEQMLERAERFSMLGQFAAGITHEICQPLNSIKIIAEGALLMNTRSGLALPEACEAFRKISARTESMEKIITNIRTLLAAQPEPDAVSDLNKCVQLFTEYSEKNFKEKGVNIYLIPCSENIVVYGSEIKIFCLLRNFTDNSLRAVKNSNLKAIYIKTGIKKDGPDAGKSFLTIEDTGCGIPESELESVFNPLRNIAGRTGLGLGLFIVRSICDSIHASIKAGNRTRGGAIFTVVFSSPGSLS